MKPTEREVARSLRPWRGRTFLGSTPSGLGVQVGFGIRRFKLAATYGGPLPGPATVPSEFGRESLAITLCASPPLRRCITDLVKARRERGADDGIRAERVEEVSFELYGTLLISCAGDGSCEAFQPPPSASINPPLAVIC